MDFPRKIVLLPPIISPTLATQIPMIRSLLSNYLTATHPTAIVVLLAAFSLYIIVDRVLYRLSAPTRELPGPKSVDWLTGSHARDVWEPDGLENQLEWTRQYGPVFKYYSWFNVSVIGYHRQVKLRNPMIASSPGSSLLICKH
jgi:hypothetical protein